MEKQTDRKTVTKALTHSGIFHADDVFASALLEILNPGIRIERVDSVPKDYDGLVFDIGMGRYDHHQQDKRVRRNGVPYAAFGLLWEEYGTFLLEQEDAEAFDEEFIQPLDWSDNTGEKNHIAQCIADFNSAWDEEVDREEAFGEAVAFAKGILERRIKMISANRKAIGMVRAMIKDEQDRILVLEHALPWKEALKKTNIVYVIFPSLRGGYIVQAVPEDEDTEKLKKPFPKVWRGLGETELKQVSGVDTLHFCHMAGFLCAVDTLPDAYKAANVALHE